jgi:predicted amidohydrolase YtcJ
MAPMLIRNAEVWGHGLADVRIEGGSVAAIFPLQDFPGEESEVIDACGGALLPGLHDHHIHLAALAARATSAICGPPQVATADQLAAALTVPGEGWLRGVGYHESVMGLPDARALDRLAPDRPVRIQHRSGRMWLLNSRALDLLLAAAAPPPGLEREGGRFTGRLFDEDQWLRGALGSLPPALAEVSRALAASGITGVTDMSPRNDPAMARHFDAEIASGRLAQQVMLAGSLDLADAAPGRLQLGPAKLHLHEAALPGFDETVAFITAAHEQGRALAVHCVSEVELVFALAAIEAAGAAAGDRVEHASVAAPHLIERIAAFGLSVCVQPHFVFERGDRYLADVEPRHHADLYRLRSLAEAGIVIAGGSDAPFGEADPWAGMAAAVSRRTRNGQAIGPDEALTPEQAVALWLADPADLTGQRRIEAGGPADLVLLDRPWREARTRLSASDVRLTVASGRIVHQRIDQTPVQREPCADPPA